MKAKDLIGRSICVKEGALEESPQKITNVERGGAGYRIYFEGGTYESVTGYEMFQLLAHGISTFFRYVFDKNRHDLIHRQFYMVIQ